MHCELHAADETFVHGDRASCMFFVYRGDGPRIFVVQMPPNIQDVADRERESSSQQDFSSYSVIGCKVLIYNITLLQIQ